MAKGPRFDPNDPDLREHLAALQASQRPTHVSVQRFAAIRASSLEQAVERAHQVLHGPQTPGLPPRQGVNLVLQRAPTTTEAGEWLLTFTEFQALS